MTKNRNYSPEFRLESAQLVVDQGYTFKAASEAMGVSKTTLESWVRKLRAERAGKAPEKGEALTPEQREIQQLKRKLRRVEEEKEILKKATVGSIGQCNILYWLTNWILTNGNDKGARAFSFAKTRALA